MAFGPYFYASYKYKNIKIAKMQETLGTRLINTNMFEKLEGKN